MKNVVKNATDAGQTPAPRRPAFPGLARRLACLLPAAACFFLSCRSGREATEGSRYCQPAAGPAFDTITTSFASAGDVYRADTALRRRYSLRDLHVANAAGVLPLLRELAASETATDARRPPAALWIRLRVLSRLQLASAQVAGVAAELDCEAERASRLAAYLGQQENARTQRLTVLSVIAGAGGTVAGALVQASTPNRAASIGGGLVSAWLGGLAVFSSKRAVRLEHSRNLLRDVWQQRRQSAVYPPFVWYVLNQACFSYGGKHSILYNTRRRWQEYVLAGLSESQQQLYFGAGGPYQADALSNRAEMLNQLQAQVRLIDQDLQGLLLRFSD